MDKKLIKYHIAISQKMKALNFNNLNVIFSIDKAQKRNPPFFGTEEAVVILLFAL
jgi:hypothetical protein